MKDFIASYTHKYDERINMDLFNRTFDHSLAEFAVNTCKNLEVLPAIKLVDWELITDQTLIDTRIDKDLAKDPKIKNNRCLERLVTPNDTIYDLLVLHFHVSARGKEADVVRKVRVPKQIGNGPYYIRNGKRVLLLIQVVDNSTFVKRNALNFKSTLYPITLYTSKKKRKVTFTDGTSLALTSFQLDLFTKVANPLLYFLASYGLDHVLELFDVADLMSVVDREIDTGLYYYIEISDGVYLEVNKRAFHANNFIGRFVGTLYDALDVDAGKITLSDVYSEDYWLGRLSEVFAKRRTADKGSRVLISFKKVADPYTRAKLKLRKFHTRNTAGIIRWMMVEYDELLRKDSNDLANKRIRANETQAFYFDSYITQNVYSVLNTDNPPFEKYIRLLNSINEFTLLKASRGGKDKKSPATMFHYERFNGFDAIEKSRYTLKGPTGLNGGKKRTSMRYRDIYASHYGRYDINVCSSNDPGLSGFLCANVKFDKDGYFDADAHEPDTYDQIIEKVIKKCAEPDYHKSRMDHLEVELSRGEDGFIQLHKRKSAEELIDMFVKDPWAFGMYPTDDGLKLIPKREDVDAQGFIKLVRRVPARTSRRKAADEPMERDADGFIVLRPVVTKMELRRQRGITKTKSKKK